MRPQPNGRAFLIRPTGRVSSGSAESRSALCQTRISRLAGLKASGQVMGRSRRSARPARKHITVSLLGRRRSRPWFQLERS